LKLLTYKYQVTNSEGKTVKGKIEAINRLICIKYLQSKNYNIIQITESDGLLSKLNQITFGKILSQKQLIFFLKQLGALLTSNIQLLDALEMLSIQQENHLIRRLYFELYLDVYNGYSFSKALEKHPKDFPLLLIRMIEVGEISGTLSKMILEMSVFYTKQFRLVSQIKSTVRMPLIYLGATVVIAIGMMLFVFPNMQDLFASFGDAKLPGVTQFLIDTGDFFSQNILLILISTVSLVAAYILLNRYSKKFHSGITYLSLNIPVFGSLIQMYNQILIANALGQMIKNGINSLRALKTTQTLIKNEIYRNVIRKTTEYIEDGLPFSKAFVESRYIDSIMANMILTGERTGDIPSFLQNMAIYYNEISDLKIEKLKGGIQPLLLIIVYAIVGAFLLALILPMLSLGTQI